MCPQAIRDQAVTALNGEEPRQLPGGGVGASWGITFSLYQVTMKPKASTYGKQGSEVRWVRPASHTLDFTPSRLGAQW